MAYGIFPKNLSIHEKEILDMKTITEMVKK